MNLRFFYELWDGKAVVGIYSSRYKLAGDHIIIYEISILKQKYNSKPKVIKVPLLIRQVNNDGIDFNYRLVLDVKKKSKRQIRILNEVT